MDDLADHMMVRVPELFFYAFRKNHRYMKKTETDRILFDGFGGLTSDELKQLGELYAAPYDSLINKAEGEEEIKNSRRVTLL